MGADRIFQFKQPLFALYRSTAKENLPAPLLHSRDFRLDEDCLTVGALMHVALVLDGQRV